MNKSIKTIIKEKLVGKILHNVEFGINELNYETGRKATLPQKIESVLFSTDEDGCPQFILKLENGESVPTSAYEGLEFYGATVIQTGLVK